MRAILRSLPVRWQITALHTLILAVVLGIGAIGLWNTQRALQYQGVVAEQLTEVRTSIPEELNLKRAAGLYPAEKPDPAVLQARYDRIATAILASGDAPAVMKKIALLNPKLADQAFPSGATYIPPDELQQIVGKLVVVLFPPDEDPMESRKKLMVFDPDLVSELFPAPTVNQVALQKYLAGLAQQLSAKDRGVLMLALDGTVLAQNDTGPACTPSVSSKSMLSDGTAGLIQKLRVNHFVQQIERGQISLWLPVIWQNDQPLALAQICVPTGAIDAGLNQLAALLVIGWVLVIGVATALGVTATRQVLQPLDQVVATTRRIAAGDLRQRVGLPPGRTELAELGAAFDAMVARLEESFTAQRRFVADAAHELRTPLTALSASVELLRMGAADDRATADRILRHLDGELNRVIRLTNDLLALSRLDARPQLALCPIELSVLLEAVGEESRALLRGQELDVEIMPELWIAGDADRLRQVVLNLLDNARKYTPADGKITLRAYSECIASPLERGGTQDAALETPLSITIEVADTGPGIPADALPHLFERFYRADEARARASGGSGLGLAIVQAIVAAHHGQVGIESAPGTGTRVMIRLPQLTNSSGQ